MTPAQLLSLFAECRRRIEAAGHGDDVAWAIYVIANSGMRFTVARGIFERCHRALRAGRPVASVFRHPGKAAAIERLWAERAKLYAEYMALPRDPSSVRVEWLGTLPWIGSVTKWHLAKNFAVDCCKPDVHLDRLGKALGMTPDALCALLARETGLRIATVDTVLWRAAAIGALDSRTGRLVEGWRPS
jgi:hypothetical protein